jgi:hypothetical protein
MGLQAKEKNLPKAVLMPRTIRTTADVNSPSTPDSFSARLVKYIPAEVITLYLTVDSILKPKLADAQLNHDFPFIQELHHIQWAVFLILLAGTPLYLIRVAGVSKRTQIIVATISFAIWVFAVGSGGPFTPLFGNDPHNTRDLIAALLLPIYTFGVALIEPTR